MAFEDLAELLDPDLHLPIKGKVYRVPAVDADTGVRFQALMAVGLAANGGTDVTDRDKELLNDGQEIDLYRDALGPAYDEMVADGVEWEFIKHAGLTAFFNVTADRKTAEQFWASGEAPAPNRQQRRAASRKAGSVGANKTRRRASTAGTTSPRKPRPKPKAAP